MGALARHGTQVSVAMLLVICLGKVLHCIHHTLGDVRLTTVAMLTDLGVTCCTHVKTTKTKYMSGIDGT